jgi:hypothetical protein
LYFCMVSFIVLVHRCSHCHSFNSFNSKYKNRQRYFQRHIKITSGVSKQNHLEPLCIIWVVTRKPIIFDCVRILFLPVRDFQDYMKIQSNLNKLSERCKRNSLFLNIDKCRTITFPKTCSPLICQPELY